MKRYEFMAKNNSLTHIAKALFCRLTSRIWRVYCLERRKKKIMNTYSYKGEPVSKSSCQKECSIMHALCCLQWWLKRACLIILWHVARIYRTEVSEIAHVVCFIWFICFDDKIVSQLTYATYVAISGTM